MTTGGDKCNFDNASLSTHQRHTRISTLAYFFHKWHRLDFSLR